VRWGVQMNSVIYETMKSRVVPGIIGAATKSTSPIKRWLQVSTLPQPVSIVFGRLYEETMNDLIEQSVEYEVITNSSEKTYITPDCQLTNVSKGNKDVDVLFRKGNVIYYREVKCNLSLDSEKSKVTAQKVQNISSRLKILFPDCEINFAILNMDWDGKKTNMHDVRIEYAGEFINRLGIEDMSKQNYLNIGQQLGRDYREGIDAR